MSFWDWRRILKIWGPPLAGIAGMVLLARLFPVAHYFLFVHHLFYIAAVMLLLNPLSETFWPSPELKKKKPILPQPSPKARARAEARKLMKKQRLPSSPAAPVDRLARLLKDKEAVDQKIEKLTAREKKYVK
ncbi:MAG: hypothetical protein L0287_03245 [Anaerolineae bacterium]|nr:hypothetical protein [Anaerolineae bacterium]